MRMHRPGFPHFLLPLSCIRSWHSWALAMTDSSDRMPVWRSIPPPLPPHVHTPLPTSHLHSSVYHKVITGHVNRKRIFWTAVLIKHIKRYNTKGNRNLMLLDKEKQKQTVRQTYGELDTRHSLHRRPHYFFTIVSFTRPQYIIASCYSWGINNSKMRNKLSTTLHHC